MKIGFLKTVASFLSIGLIIIKGRTTGNAVWLFKVWPNYYILLFYIQNGDKTLIFLKAVLKVALFLNPTELAIPRTENWMIWSFVCNFMNSWIQYSLANCVKVFYKWMLKTSEIMCFGIAVFNLKDYRDKSPFKISGCL